MDRLQHAGAGPGRTGFHLRRDARPLPNDFDGKRRIEVWLLLELLGQILYSGEHRVRLPDWFGLRPEVQCRISQPLLPGELRARLPAFTARLANPVLRSVS